MNETAVLTRGSGLPRGVRGAADPAFAWAVRQFAAMFPHRRFGGGALSVYLDGEPVVDVWTGWSDRAGRQHWDADTGGPDPRSRPVLDRAVKVFTDFPNIRIEISGHTDSTGSLAHNRDLSRRRAEAVKRYLVEHSIETGRIETRGAGPDEPVDSNRTPAGRARNRRIEFQLIVDGKPSVSAVIAKMCESLGLTADTAIDGWDALRQASLARRAGRGYALAQPDELRLLHLAASTLQAPVERVLDSGSPPSAALRLRQPSRPSRRRLQPGAAVRRCEDPRLH